MGGQVNFETAVREIIADPRLTEVGKIEQIELLCGLKHQRKLPSEEAPDEKKRSGVFRSGELK